MLEPLPQPPFTSIYREKMAFGTMAARPNELMVHPEVTGSPRKVGSFSPKQFRGPGEPEASLGELGSRKLPFVIFPILDKNIE